jgi:predicted phage-related endonuclease
MWGDPDVSGHPVIPDPVLCQIAWYNMVLESWGGGRLPFELEDFSRVSVLIGGQDYREYTVPRDLDFEQSLLEAGLKFWENNVLSRVPPDPSESEGQIPETNFR